MEFARPRAASRTGMAAFPPDQGNDVDLDSPAQGRRLVLVMGGTGLVGGAVVRGLLSYPWFRVLVATRRPWCAEAMLLQQAGAGLVEVDFNYKYSLVVAMQNVKCVFLHTMFWENYSCTLEIVHGRNAVEAALEAGVEHLVFNGTNYVPTDCGRVCSYLRSKLEIESIIKESAIAYTIVVLPFYFENFLTVFRPFLIAPNLYAMTLPLENCLISCACLHDMALCICKIIQQGAVYQYQKLTLAAEMLSVQQMITHLQKGLGKYDFIDPKLTVEDFHEFGFLGAKDLAAMFLFYQLCEDIPDFSVTRTLNPHIRTMAEWITDNKEQLIDVLEESMITSVDHEYSKPLHLRIAKVSHIEEPADSSDTTVDISPACTVHLTPPPSGQHEGHVSASVNHSNNSDARASGLEAGDFKATQTTSCEADCKRSSVNTANVQQFLQADFEAVQRRLRDMKLSTMLDISSDTPSHAETSRKRKRNRFSILKRGSRVIPTLLHRRRLAKPGGTDPLPSPRKVFVSSSDCVRSPKAHVLQEIGSRKACAAGLFKQKVTGVRELHTVMCSGQQFLATPVSRPVDTAQSRNSFAHLQKENSNRAERIDVFVGHPAVLVPTTSDTSGSLLKSTARELPALQEQIQTRKNDSSSAVCSTSRASPDGVPAQAGQGTAGKIGRSIVAPCSSVDIASQTQTSFNDESYRNIVKQAFSRPRKAGQGTRGRTQCPVPVGIHADWEHGNNAISPYLNTLKPGPSAQLHTDCSSMLCESLESCANTDRSRLSTQNSSAGREGFSPCDNHCDDGHVLPNVPTLTLVKVLHVAGSAPTRETKGGRKSQQSTSSPKGITTTGLETAVTEDTVRMKALEEITGSREIFRETSRRQKILTQATLTEKAVTPTINTGKTPETTARCKDLTEIVNRPKDLTEFTTRQDLIDINSPTLLQENATPQTKRSYRQRQRPATYPQDHKTTNLEMVPAASRCEGISSDTPFSPSIRSLASTWTSSSSSTENDLPLATNNNLHFLHHVLLKGGRTQRTAVFNSSFCPLNSWSDEADDDSDDESDDDSDDDDLTSPTPLFASSSSSYGSILFSED